MPTSQLEAKNPFDLVSCKSLDLDYICSVYEILAIIDTSCLIFEGLDMIWKSK